METLKLLFMPLIFGAMPALADCPPVQFPDLDSPTAAAARDAYLSDVMADGARQALIRGGFCPFEDGPEVKLLENDRYSVTEWFEHLNSEQRIMESEVDVESNGDGTFSEGLVTVKDYGISGLAEKKPLSLEQSLLFHLAMSTASVPKDPRAINHEARRAGFLTCRKDGPSEKAACTFIVLDQTYPFDQALAESVHANLKGLGAITKIGEIELTAALLVECIRFDGSDVSACSLYVQGDQP